MKRRNWLLLLLALLALLGALTARSYHPFMGPVRVLDKGAAGPVCWLSVQPVSQKTGEAKGAPERALCGRADHDAAEPGKVYDCGRDVSALVPVGFVRRLTPRADE